MPRIRPRLLVALAALAAALAAPSAALARAEAGIELSDGNGRVLFALRGALIGSLAEGRVTVRAAGRLTQVSVQGYEWVRRAVDGEVVYGGADLRYRIFRGGWRVVVQGLGIDASAAGRGLVVLRGDGLLSIDGGPDRRWPDAQTTIRLGEGQRATARSRLR